jgi:hypothetical protein
MKDDESAPIPNSTTTSRDVNELPTWIFNLGQPRGDPIDRQP